MFNESALEGDLVRRLNVNCRAGETRSTVVEGSKDQSEQRKNKKCGKSKSQIK